MERVALKHAVGLQVFLFVRFELIIIWLRRLALQAVFSYRLSRTDGPGSVDETHARTHTVWTVTVRVGG